MAAWATARIGYFAVAAGIVFLLVWEIRRVVRRRERKMSVRIPTGVGDFNAQRRFIESHKPFLQEFPALQSLIAEASRLSERKCYPASQGEQADAEPTDEELAQRVAFFLEKAAYEDFGELLILAGNGMGIGAKKTLRSIYERLVTAMFI